MAEAFEPITTQEAFDAAVEQRLAPYADYNEIKAQNEKYAGQIVELNSRIQTYETEALKTRIAHEVGIPFDLALLKLIQPKNPPAPLRGDPDPSGGSRRDALRTFTNQLMNND